MDFVEVPCLHGKFGRGRSFYPLFLVISTDQTKVGCSVAQVVKDASMLSARIRCMHM